MCNLPEDKCTGCGTCVASCPFKAISIKEDNEGFLYPYIDTSKCKKCGLCEKRCPVLKVKKYRKNDFFLYCGIKPWDTCTLILYAPNFPLICRADSCQRLCIL